MKPWTVDADDIRIAGDLEDTLVYRTPSIDDFLRQRSDKFIVTATKGFGKTLILKAQRIALEENGVLCLPVNGLIDKPVGDRVFSDQMIRLYANSNENWRRVWLISIAAATLKMLELTDGLAVNPRLGALIADPHLRGVIDHFVNILGFPRSDLFRSADETDASMLPRLRNINRPVAIFIDSVDEYFKKHLLAMTASDTGELDRGVWYFSQMGLVEAAYQVRRITHHLKVFAAVRKEAFARFDETTEMVQQYRGSAIDLTYPAESLHEIFANNIQREPKRNLVAPGKLSADRVVAFVGLNEVTHSYTRENEKIFDYIFRHTLGRPRDLMTIGQRLSDLAPEDRTEASVKQAINQASTGIAQEYMNEIQPYVGDVPINEILAMLPGNIIPAAAVEETFRDRDTHRHGFVVLCNAGLVGIVDIDPVTSQKVQSFRLPGEHRLGLDGALASSPHYLVHPILTQIISSLNEKYVGNIDRTNVIGRGRVWRDPDPDRRLCVLKGDIHKFSDLMEEGLEESVRVAFQEIASSHGRDCIQCEISNGDQLTIVHGEPGALIKAAKRIVEDMYEVSGHPRLRMAIDFGPVRLRTDTEGHPITTGSPFRRAARIEPHVPTNQIWVTDDFRNELEKGDTFYAVVPVEYPGSDQDPDEKGRFNVKKPGSDERDLWIALYQVEDRKF